MLFVPTRTLLRLFFASSRCLAFISLAPAFTAINTDSAVIFFYCCDFFFKTFIKCLFMTNSAIGLIL